MKKFIMLSAVMAAVSTAFIACSSDDDLAQQPKAPETIVDTPKGTPFSLTVSADTRATLYNADAWGKGTTGKVTNLKLYGKQPSYDAWMDHIFTREPDSFDWTATLDASTGVGATAPNWPTGAQSTEATKFYAITDGAIAITTDPTDPKVGTPIAGVDDGTWMKYIADPTDPVASFDYTLPTTTSDILWYVDNGYDFSNDVYNSYTYVTNTALTDLMVASAEATEASTDEGKLSLSFTHALAGLTIKALFVSDGEKINNASATVKSVMVCGLHGAGTYTFGASTPWTTSTAVNYYYELPTPKVFAAQAEGGSYTPVEIVPAGTWLAIPQTVTAWDEKGQGYPTSGAYIAVRMHDSTYDLDYILCFPLTMTKALVAGKNRVITINIADGRDVFASLDGDYAAHFYTPASSVVLSRTYNFDE